MKKNKPIQLRRAISAGPPRTTAELKAHFGCSLHQVKDTLTRLKKRGLIKQINMAGRMHWVSADFQLPYADLLALVMARTVEEGDCALWTGSCDAQVGYPQMRYEGQAIRVQNLLWRAAGKEHPPETRLVMKCENKRCILPGHTVAVDRPVPYQMAAADGKFSTLVLRAKRAKSMQDRQGVFSQEDVALIRGSDKTTPELMDELGASRETINAVKRGATYRTYNSSPFSGLGARA